MILSNTETIPGKRIVRFLGLVGGNTIRCRHLGNDLLAGFKNLVGGEVTAYTKLMSEARNEATERMIQMAQSRGANAIVNIRFSTASVMQAAAEVYAYGTAVVVED